MQNGTSMVDDEEMTRLRLKLLDKRLEHKNMDDRAESAQSARSYDAQMDALHHALRRKQDLLQRLKEQHMLEEFNRPHTWGGSRRQDQSHFVTALPPIAPTHIYQPAAFLPSLPPAPPAPPQPPRIIQQTLPQHPATIIQQLPQQPVIAQVPPAQYPAPRSGSIKEDMVEMMLMQNAQMHQIIMQNMMLKAMPSMALAPPGGPVPYPPHTTYLGQDSYQGNQLFLRPDVKPRGGVIHHHHHYGPTPAAPQLPPISYTSWPPGVSSVPAGPLQSLHHVTAAPVTLPPL